MRLMLSVAEPCSLPSLLDPCEPCEVAAMGLPTHLELKLSTTNNAAKVTHKVNDAKFSWKVLPTPTTSGLHGPNERSQLLVASSGLVQADDSVYRRGSKMLPLSSSASNCSRESTTQLLVLTMSRWSTAIARGDAVPSLATRGREVR